MKHSYGCPYSLKMLFFGQKVDLEEFLNAEKCWDFSGSQKSF